MNKRAPVLVALLTLVVVLAAAIPAAATHSWNGYHWARTANAFTLQLIDNVTLSWDGYLTTTSTDWSAGSAVLDTAVVTGSDVFRDRKQCKPVTGKVKVCNATYGFTGWLGLAQIWISGSHITQGLSKVNDTYFNTSTYSNANAKQHVMCQEIGHTFGLGHQYTEPSCMDDRNGLFDPAYISPGPHDFAQLELIYAHLDSTSTVAAAAAAAAASAVEDPVPGLVASQGRRNVYAQDLGNGRRLVTFVFWATR